MKAKVKHYSWCQRLFSGFLALPLVTQMTLMVLAIGSQLLLAIFQVSYYKAAYKAALVDASNLRAYVVVVAS